MKTIKMSYEMARACAQDAADTSMRAAHRTAWNEEDYDIAAALFLRLLPEPSLEA